LRIIEWLDEVNEDDVFLNVATMTELLPAIDRLPAGTRRRSTASPW